MRPARARAAAGRGPALVLLGLLLAGCGSGSDDGSGTSAAQQPAGTSDSEFDFGDNDAGDDTAEAPPSDEADEPGAQDGAKRPPRSDSGTGPAIEEDAGTTETPAGRRSTPKLTVIEIAQNQVQAGMIQMIPDALDERNRVEPKATTPVALTVLDFPKVAGVSVDWSIDGGKTWQAAPVSGEGTKWTAKVPGAASGSAISLRVTAKATTGATTQQTVIGAYGVR